MTKSAAIRSFATNAGNRRKLHSRIDQGLVVATTVVECVFVCLESRMYQAIALFTVRINDIQRAGFSLTTCLTRRSYAGRSFLNRLYASAWAGDSGFGSFSRS